MAAGETGPIFQHVLIHAAKVHNIENDAVMILARSMMECGAMETRLKFSYAIQSLVQVI